jgi:isopropylmalate/homocitrate/citramalate synthase
MAKRKRTKAKQRAANKRRTNQANWFIANASRRGVSSNVKNAKLITEYMRKRHLDLTQQRMTKAMRAVKLLGRRRKGQKTSSITDRQALALTALLTGRKESHRRGTWSNAYWGVRQSNRYRRKRRRLVPY